MSVHSGTLTLRSVHPASPVLLQLVQVTPTTYMLSLSSLPKGLELQLLSDRLAFARASTFLKPRCVRTQQNPRLTARYRGQSLHCLASRLSFCTRKCTVRRSLEPGRVAAYTLFQQQLSTPAIEPSYTWFGSSKVDQLDVIVLVLLRTSTHLSLANRTCSVCVGS
jgi:hypothetical protein